jgi:glycosyltransferase involved in cell wall biosynthesis
LTIAGTGPDEPQLRRLAADLAMTEAVHFCGRLDRDQMAELYRSSGIVLNPSRVDNMPNSVLEAMASGTPVVSTNVGGVPFIVRDGVTAILVEAGDHAAMAAGALQLLRNSSYASQLRQAALCEVQQYSWQRVRQRWANIYAAARSGARLQIRAA